jgi:hypothetical protein
VLHLCLQVLHESLSIGPLQVFSLTLGVLLIDAAGAIEACMASLCLLTFFLPLGFLSTLTLRICLLLLSLFPVDVQQALPGLASGLL